MPPLIATLCGLEKGTLWLAHVGDRTFFGIVIRMFYREHGVIHFHAEYQGEQATFTLDGEILAGNIRSRTARRLIKQWSLAHGAELKANWSRARAGEVLERITPLD